MQEEYGQYLIGYLVSFSGIYILLCASSLRYHINKYKPTKQTIVEFLENVHSPLSLFFSVAPRYNLFTYDTKKNLSDVLHEQTLLDVLITNIISLGIGLLLLGVPLGNLLDAIDMSMGQLLFHGFFFLFGCLCFGHAWQFGHRIKYMMDINTVS